MLTAELFLIAGLIGSSYSYFIYPIILLLFPKKHYELHNSDSGNEINPPFLTFIITAYNEEKSIKEKIINTLETDYPKDKREILIASDGSTDRTNQYVNEFKLQGVKLIEVKERKGKENAQLAAICEAKGDILVFSDVTTRIQKNALQTIARAFSHPKIGAVSSEDRFLTEDGKIAGEGAYVKYEMWLRKLESSVFSLVGLSGSFFSVRKEICQDWDIKVPSDFNTALNSVKKGYIVITEPELLGFYPNIKDESKEYQRKLRTVIRGMAAIAQNPEILIPFKLGFFSFEVISHKIMRWLVPWFLLALLVSNLIVWQNHPVYTILLAAQLAFYTLAIVGWLFKSARSNILIKIPFFFMQVNIAIAHAGLQFASGKRITVWEPSKR